MLPQTPFSCLRSRVPLAPSHVQKRTATLLRRPKRPYTFTQLVTLSDGSAFVQRTTSPQAVYKSNKDTRNSALWNPSSQKLLNIEEDEAGKLALFRARFGRSWDAEGTVQERNVGVRGKKQDADEGKDTLLDLISGYASGAQGEGGKSAKQSDAKDRKR